MVVRFFASLRGITGEKEIEWPQEAPTLGRLLALLADRYGPEFRRWVLEDGELGGAVIVLVNGQDARHRGGLEMSLRPEDSVAILPMMAGGTERQPFDAAKLARLMDDAGLAVLLACSRHNVRYLTGGYYYHFHAHSTRMGRTQYLPFVGVPRHLEQAFYVGRAEERGQMDAEGLWIPDRIDAVRGTASAAEAAAVTLGRRGLGDGRIGVELPFLPAEAFLALRRGLPRAELVDATPVLDELRAVKSAAELARLRSVYDRVAEAIRAAFARGVPGITTAEVARQVEWEMARRGLTFLLALTAAGPQALRAPSAARWERGEVLHIDAGGEEGDYLADICRMGSLGEPPRLARELHGACIAVQGRVRERVRAGLPCGELLLEGQRAVREHRFAEFGRFVAHGIGMVSHEQPDIAPGSPRPLEAGMVLSIETEFLHPEVGHVKLEDAVAVAPRGCEGLGDLGRDWHVVPA
jgi:MoaD family protein